MYYLGGLVDLVGSYFHAIVRSMLSCCVPPTELGKVFALLSAAESSIPLGISPGYSALFEATITTVPGTVFFVSTGLCVVAFVLSCYVLISLKGHKMSEVTAQGSGRGVESTNEEIQFSDFTKISYI